MPIYGKRGYLLPAIQTQSSVSSTQVGSEINLGGTFSKFTMEVINSSTKSCIVQFQTSISGNSSAWTTKTTWSCSSGSGSVSGAVSLSSGPYIYVRTPLVGMTTTETVSVYVAASQ